MKQLGNRLPLVLDGATLERHCRRRSLSCVAMSGRSCAKGRFRRRDREGSAVGTPPPAKLSVDCSLLANTGVGVPTAEPSRSRHGNRPFAQDLHSSPRNSNDRRRNDAPVSPPSSTSGKRFPSCFITWSAPEHDGNPDTFALVPVNRPLELVNQLIHHRAFGQRSATLPVLAVTFSGTRLDASITRVKPPGQNASASRVNFIGGIASPAVSSSRSASASAPAPAVHTNRQRTRLRSSLHAVNLIHRRLN